MGKQWMVVCDELSATTTLPPITTDGEIITKQSTTVSTAPTTGVITNTDSSTDSSTESSIDTTLELGTNSTTESALEDNTALKAALGAVIGVLVVLQIITLIGCGAIVRRRRNTNGSYQRYYVYVNFHVLLYILTLHAVLQV